MDAYDSTYDDSIKLVQNVTRAFYYTAEKLDDNRDNIRHARIACGVAVGVGVGVSVVAAAATGGLSVLVGGAAVSGVALAIFMALTHIANKILDHKDIRGLESQWKTLKVEFLRDKNIPQENRTDIEKWATHNLSDKEKEAVLAALDKSITDSRSTKRLEKMKDGETEVLLESLLFLVLADFSAFEILVGAMRRKNERPGAAVRRIALQMDGYRDDLIEAKLRKLERIRLLELSEKRRRQEDEEMTKSVHEKLLLGDEDEAKILQPELEEDGPNRPSHTEEGEEGREARLVSTQKQKRMEKERLWRQSVEESHLPHLTEEDWERERLLIEVEQRQRRLAKQEHWQRCMEEELERKAREVNERKEERKREEQHLMDREEEEQQRRLLSEQDPDLTSEDQILPNQDRNVTQDDPDLPKDDSMLTQEKEELCQETNGDKAVFSVL